MVETGSVHREGRMRCQGLQRALCLEYFIAIQMFRIRGSAANAWTIQAGDTNRDAELIRGRLLGGVALRRSSSHRPQC